MLKPRPVLVVLGLAAALWAADQPTGSANCLNTVPGASACAVSPQDRKDAKTAFERGLKLQKAKRLDEAFSEFEHASQLVPQDSQYLTLKELVRQQLVFEHIQKGNNALGAGNQIGALGEFRAAVHLDPDNRFANQRRDGGTRPFIACKMCGSRRVPFPF